LRSLKRQISESSKATATPSFDNRNDVPRETEKYFDFQLIILETYVEKPNWKLLRDHL